MTRFVSQVKDAVIHYEYGRRSLWVSNTGHSRAVYREEFCWNDGLNIINVVASREISLRPIIKTSFTFSGGLREVM